jgi:cardiolipin synthase
VSSHESTARRLTKGLAIFGAGALVLHGWRLGLTLLGSPRRYRVASGLPPVDSSDFARYLSTIADAQIHHDTRIQVLPDGDSFYPAELAAIRAAEHSVNLEAYEFLEGNVTREFLDALTARARAGVDVRLVIDAIGSWNTHSAYFDSLRVAGGRLSWYHPVKSRTWPYLNNRTHRKLLVVDGRIGFIGGAGFADQWVKPNASGAQWRDTVLRVEGGAVSGLNGVFAENWLETTAEILGGPRIFPDVAGEPGVPALVVTSTPHTGTTRARILYQTLLASARRSIHITTPYFVPDRSARTALLHAVRDRGVQVRVLTAGPYSDHPITRRVSRMLDSRLAKAGTAIYEYQPSMIHAKLMTVDGVWTVAGSTNFDHRSFALNDEVNIAVFDRGIAGEVDRHFARDLSHSVLLTPQRLQDADLADRAEAELSWVIRREQ